MSKYVNTVATCENNHLWWYLCPYKGIMYLATGVFVFKNIFKLIIKYQFSKIIKAIMYSTNGNTADIFRPQCPHNLILSLI